MGVSQLLSWYMGAAVLQVVQCIKARPNKKF